jgi:hypothetical protein
MFFDEQTGILNLDEQMQLRPSFQKIMADEKVTEEEIEEQSQLLISLLKEIETLLHPEQLAKVRDVLAEMGVLYAISQIKQLQEIQH